jgi:hypothetical protein
VQLGKRGVHVRISNSDTATVAELVELQGKRLTADVDGKRRFEKTLADAPKGRIGLWSTADSQVLFDDFRVESLDAASTKSPVGHDP